MKVIKYRLSVLIVATILSITLSLFPQTKLKHSPTEVKSYLLFRIPKHIEWPESCGVNDPSQPFVLGVIGENSMIGYLHQLTLKKTILNKKVVFRQVIEAKDIDGCHLLFVSSISDRRLTKLLALINTKPVLIIGDTPGYGAKGVHINFLMKDDRMRFELNIHALKETGLIPSSYLVKSAYVVIQ